MSGVNKVILIGNLGKDPEVRYLENGIAVARFTLATSENFKDRTSGERRTVTEWHNIVLWRGLAEIAEKFLKKGSQVYIEGKLKTSQYQDKEGQTKYITEVQANNMTMLGSRTADGSGSDQNNAPSAASSNPTPSAPPATPPAQSDDSGEDDLPF